MLLQSCAVLFRYFFLLTIKDKKYAIWLEMGGKHLCDGGRIIEMVAAVVESVFDIELEMCAREVSSLSHQALCRV